MRQGKEDQTDEANQGDELEFFKTLTPEQVREFFKDGGNAGASTFGQNQRHPMYRTESVDYAVVLEGEIVMLLDDEDVHLKAGDIVIQRGTNHAWSNRSGRPCTIAFSSHGGYW